MKGRKMLEEWTTQDTHIFYFTHFKVFTIILTLFNKRWVQYMLSHLHKKSSTMGKRQYQSCFLAPDINFLYLPTRKEERASNIILLYIKYGKSPMTNIFQLQILPNSYSIFLFSNQYHTGTPEYLTR